jgi:glycopeptide antibiotics resistance protein
VVPVSIFFLYALSVVAVTVFPIVVRPQEARGDVPWWIVVQWVPFRAEALGFLLNVIMFVPLGVLMPVLWRSADSVRRTVMVSLAASTAIELTQLVLWLTLGSFRTVDVNDLIANTAGGLAGLMLVRAAHRALHALM